MRTPVLMISLLAAAAAPVIAETEVAVEDRPTYTTKPLANDPHAAHSACHTFLQFQIPSCAPIRQQEKDQYTADAATGTQTAVVDIAGVKSTGRRDLYPQGNISKLTSETTASAAAWLTRFKPLALKLAPGTSAHHEFEKRSIVSCDDYAYKRYYTANRHLDSIGQLTAANRYTDAVNVILDGVPATLVQKRLPPVSEGVSDYEGRAISGFNNTITSPYPLAPIAPPITQNPFFGAPTTLLTNLPLTGAAWEQYLPGALAASSSRPAESANTWEAARSLRTNPQITSLSAAERDDIAQRVTRMRRASYAAMKSFEKCTLDEFRRFSGNTNQLPLGQTFEQYVSAVTDRGDVDPIDFDQLTLMSRLVDDALSTSTLGNVLSTNISTKDLYGTLARTHTGSLLRKLSSLNVSALQQAVAGTKTTFKSGTWSPCTAGFYEVAALLVEEYRRGPAGCMAPNTARCDFSLPVFTRDVADKLTSYISTTDDSKDLCVTYLGNDFVNGAAQVPPASRTDLVTFESFFRTQRDAIQQILRDTPTSSELPNAIGDRRGGGSIFGDASRFAASYSYEAEWGVNVIQWKDVAKTKPCRLGGQIEGRLDAGVTLFGVNKNLVDAGLKARTIQTDASLSAADKVASFDAHVELLGIDIFTIDDEPLPTSYSKENEDSFDISLVRTTVLLGFIPVTIAAGFGFDYGYRLNAAFTQSSCIDSPSLKMSADVRPHAGADAYVEAYVDLFIAGAGVKGELTLLDAALPFDASVAVIQQPTGWAVDASSSLVLELTELSGAISFVVKVIGITVWETELFSWAGIRQRVPLWETDVTFPLIGFDILY